MKENRIKKLEVLAETKFLSLFDATYINRGGREKHWTIASRKSYDKLREKYFGDEEDSLDAVVIAAYHEESGKLVLIRQFRIPINSYVYELPAGLIDPNENEESTIGRELKEETGLELVSVKHNLSLKRGYMSPGMTDESASLIYCTCKGEITNKFLEEDEDIYAFMVSPKEAEELLKSGEKMDMKLSVILRSFAILGEKMFIE
ncbi:MULTISPECIES: NUDIX hydrolase [Clostridium]|uniref:ADP-ribose pyrophosphatase n=1 Tax=Clostridium cadaveris TaxID=1529 RepID=A0A1I2KC11_9CLOT|nr:NUDIX hydrolase [Clostridium cadaveris]MDU4952098.1 NUDIX hydrolase [Clostridium sp.]MDM8310585.1 NUDIX hydrolase [Clostridium cadaveris]MDY4949673.1 NUDIX hydrolase [Clostridium cadaveris]NME65136.1 NUDIX hydrolase [Clostridium cadaveris]PWL51330.1 MAG: NUDIX hydrolase [Clostridium cadaveris]